MRKIYYGIAGYQRPQCKTLHTLLKLGVERDRILVSLNDEKDYATYLAKYQDLGVRIVFRYGTNVASNRNNILDSFCNGDYVVVLDDDITSFVRWTSYQGKARGKFHQMDKTELEEVLLESFETTLKNGGRFFGTYSIKNDGFCQETVKKQGVFGINKMFQGGFTGHIVDRDTRYDSSMLLLDDYELILRSISKGRFVFRRNDIVAVKGKMRENKGGYYGIYKAGGQEIWMSKLYEKYSDMIHVKKDFKGVILKKGWWTV